MAILTFMSDKHLNDCIYNLCKSYAKKKKKSTLDDLYKNSIDPIKAHFDMELHGMTAEKFMYVEAARQADKSLNNKVGEFHQDLFNGIQGVEAPPKAGYDIRKIDNTLFAELKNKHNTMNSSSAETTFKKLKKLADNNPNAMCYLVEVVAKKSQDIEWEVSYDKSRHSHTRIRRISIDKFYELLTGDPDAFKKLCDAIRILTPKIKAQFPELQTTSEEIESIENEAYDTLLERAQTEGISELDKLFIDNFTNYNGF